MWLPLVGSDCLPFLECSTVSQILLASTEKIAEPSDGH